MTKTIITDLNFDISINDIKSYTTEIMKKEKSFNDSIASIPLSDANFDNVLRVIAEFEGIKSHTYYAMDLLSYVSNSKEIRDACSEADKVLSEFRVEQSMRIDVYNVIKSVSKQGLNKIELRYLEETLKACKRLGLDLDEDKRNALIKAKKRKSELQIDFKKNIADDKSHVILSNESELNGMPSSYIESHKTEQGDFKITKNYPDVIPILSHCSISETREKVMRMFTNRAANNAPLFEEILKLRLECAKLLGFKNNSEFILDDTMAGKVETLQEFLGNLETNISSVVDKDLEILTKLKGSKLNPWDISFYNKLDLKQNYQVDELAIKEYFPTDFTVQAMLDFYADVMSLSFKEISAVEPVTSWDKLVRKFECRDRESNNLMGHFYMDLFPREGKYSHACAIGLLPGFQETIDGEIVQHLPLSILICNFETPSGDKPGLLTFREFETLLHEFGHVIHGICGGYKNAFSAFHGTSVKRDFVEAPSQMKEQWAYEKVVLKRLSSHYLKKEPLPDELIKNLQRSKYVFEGYHWGRQLGFAMYDQTIHTMDPTPNKDEISRIFKDCLKRGSHIELMKDSHSELSFGHMAGGYDSRYYGYIWAIVIAKDLYSKFEESKEGPISPTVGKRYREIILESGGTRDPTELVEEFLERPLSQNAFLKSFSS